MGNGWGVWTEMSDRFDLDKIEEEAQGVLLISTMKDGVEIAFCGEVDCEYVGWTPRDLADLRGFSYRSAPNPKLLALVEAVRAAQNFIATYNNATTLPDTTDARIALIAALKPFGDAA